MTGKIPIYDKRMIELMEHCITTGRCDTQKDFFKKIGFNETSFKDVRNGTRSFTIEQMIKAATLYKVNMNWLAGFDNEFKRIKAKDPILQLKDAVLAIETEVKNRR